MSTTEKSIVFRVAGLPASKSNDELTGTLSTFIQRTLSKEEKLKLKVTVDIVPSCYDEKQEKVALVEFKSAIPSFLSTLDKDPLANWPIELQNQALTFDRHFFGFTQLYVPRTDKPLFAEYVAFF